MNHEQGVFDHAFRELNAAQLLVVAGVLSLTANVAVAQTSMKMALDWNFEGQHSPFALAADNGIFAKHGLSVTVDRGFGSATL